jgi:hypothetical protein
MKITKQKGVNMKLGKIALAALLAGSVFATTASADVALGFKYYKKEVFRKTHIKAKVFLHKLGFTRASQVEQLKKLFENNGKPLVKLVEKKMGKKAAKGIEKIIKKNKLKDLEDFLVGFLTGSYVPASCS